jgi:GTP-binding protein Era
VPDPPIPSHRCGYAAIAGIPNAGKSTLLNALTGLRLAIIAPKPQTTRRNVIGILTADRFQAILVDTPGLLDPAYRLHKAMQSHARSAIHGADVLLLLLDAPRALKTGASEQMVLARDAAGSHTPMVVAINKVDRVEKDLLLPLIEELDQEWSATALVPISALNHDGLDRLLDETVALLPEGPPLYPADAITEQPERFFVAEFVREVVFNHFREEVPYGTVTQVEEFRRGPGKTYIRVMIYVDRESHRPIVLGKGGRTIKALGREARKVIEEFLSEEVYLELRVKVRKDWREHDAELRDLELL